MTWDPNGPMTALDKLGIHPVWVNEEFRIEHKGKPQWNYASAFLSTKAIRDLAHLVIDGWHVFVKPAGNNKVHIQIRKDGNP